MAPLPPIPRDCISCDAYECQQTAPSKRCSRCQRVYYCSAACQKSHWKQHREDCVDVKEIRRSMMGLGGKGGAVLLSDSKVTAINSECAFCLESEIKNPIVLEECKHAFCSPCLLRYQERKINSLQMVESERTCPVCRSEIGNQMERLLDSAVMNGERANKPGCTSEEKAKFLAMAMADLEQALSADKPDLDAFVIKSEILIALGDGKAALECIDELLSLNAEIREERRPLDAMVAQANAAMARGDEHGAELINSAIARMIEESGLPSIILSDDNESRNGIELRRAEAYELMEDWKAAKDIYLHIFEQTRQEPNDVPEFQKQRAFEGMCRCFYKRGIYPLSIDAAKIALLMDRHTAGVYKYKALSEKASGDIDAAVTTMNQAVLYETPWDEENKAKVLKLYNELLEERAAAG